MDPMYPVKIFPWNITIPSLPNKKPRALKCPPPNPGNLMVDKVGRLPNDTWSDHPYVLYILYIYIRRVIAPTSGNYQLYMQL